VRALAELHAADGLAVEAALYFAQYAEDRVRAQDHAEAAYGYRKAFESSRDQVQWLERLAEVLIADGQTPIALSVLSEAIGHHRTQGHEAEAARCEAQARQIDPSFVAGVFKPLPVAAPAPVAAVVPEPEGKVVEPVFESHAAAVVDPATVSAPEPGFERTRVFASPTHAAPASGARQTPRSRSRRSNVRRSMRSSTRSSRRLATPPRPRLRPTRVRARSRIGSISRRSSSVPGS
jgi:hypothetical protein